MAHATSLFTLVIANLLIPVAILTFAVGFFPYKPFLPGKAQFHGTDSDQSPEAPFDKVVFMVVDALRSDFVYSNESGFTFTQSLIRSGAAIPFTAHATSPTITMPRIKAITTGSIPSFLDVILNFAESDTSSSLATQDTWPAQLGAKSGGMLLMYGDDTWLKLFPDTFSRSDGTSSFFVSDFTEVDRNVTRHLDLELEQSDWNGMILHYLGLDHIGHKSGPRSPYMVPKHHEMDSVVKQLYEAMESKEHLASTLLVLCGDHGMNDAGNHGGSAAGETSPALVFIAPKLRTISSGFPCPADSPEDDYQYYNVVEQSDIAPTLAGLLGFPIPVNNLGVFMPELLHFWPPNERVLLMKQNAQQVLRIMKATFGDMFFDNVAISVDCDQSLSKAESLKCLWGKVERMDDDGPSNTGSKLMLLTEVLQSTRSIMSSTASNYDIAKLQLGTLFAAIAACVTLAGAALSAPTAAALNPWSWVIASSYAAMMFASSYVEEEQYFWYWMASGWLAWLYVKLPFLECRSIRQQTWRLPFLIIVHRIICRWNQTGQKHAGESDIARTFLAKHNVALWILVIVTLIDLTRRLACFSLSRAGPRIASFLSIALCFSVYSFKVVFTIADAPELLAGIPQYLWRPAEWTLLLYQARMVFGSIALLVVFNLYQRIFRDPDRKVTGRVDCSLHDLITVFLVMQTKLNNVPLFLLFYIELEILGSLNLDPVEITLTSILFQHASFFAYGGSNAISSIDLSNAYNGVSGYNVTAVGLLTFASNWSGPIWWTSATNLLLLQNRSRGQSGNLTMHITSLTVFTASSLLSVMLACTLLRTHLFIWTVFSPRYLYSMAWSLGQHLCIDVVFGSMLFWIGS